MAAQIMTAYALYTTQTQVHVLKYFFSIVKILPIISKYCSDYILLCYKNGSVQNLENLEKKWIPEIQKVNKNAELLMVATKTDLDRSDSQFR